VLLDVSQSAGLTPGLVKDSDVSVTAEAGFAGRYTSPDFDGLPILVCSSVSAAAPTSRPMPEQRPGVARSAAAGSTPRAGSLAGEPGAPATSGVEKPDEPWYVVYAVRRRQWMGGQVVQGKEEFDRVRRQFVSRYGGGSVFDVRSGSREGAEETLRSRQKRFARN
jgi:hypothetical protein